MGIGGLGLGGGGVALGGWCGLGVSGNIFVILAFCLYFFSPVWPNAFGGVGWGIGLGWVGWGCWPIPGCGGLMGCVHSRDLGRFILLGSLSNTLIVVSILDIVYDCHL